MAPGAWNFSGAWSLKLGCFFWLHAHYLIAGIDINDLSGDGGGPVAGKKGAGGAEFVGEYIAFQGRVGFIMLEHFGKAADAAGGEGIHWAGADAIDADFFRAEIVRQITRAGFQRSFGDAHYVVVRHDFFRAVV